MKLSLLQFISSVIGDKLDLSCEFAGKGEGREGFEMKCVWSALGSNVVCCLTDYSNFTFQNLFR